MNKNKMMDKIQIKKRDGMLDTKENFVSWAYENIENQHFTEGKDFFKKNEYEVTISTAKSLLMFEIRKTDKRIWEIYNFLALKKYNENKNRSNY